MILTILSYIFIFLLGYSVAFFRHGKFLKQCVKIIDDLILRSKKSDTKASIFERGFNLICDYNQSLLKQLNLQSEIIKELQIINKNLQGLEENGRIESKNQH